MSSNDQMSFPDFPNTHLNTRMRDIRGIKGVIFSQGVLRCVCFCPHLHLQAHYIREFPPSLSAEETFCQCVSRLYAYFRSYPQLERPTVCACVSAFMISQRDLLRVFLPSRFPISTISLMPPLFSDTYGFKPISRKSIKAII